MVLVERGLVRTRSRASDMIRRGAVLVDGTVRTKSGFLVGPESRISVSKENPEFEIALNSVGRGAVKLSFALEKWEIVPSGLCIDIGASTGGFTEVLLKRGAKRVIAVDVGRGQLAPGLRADSRVISLEELDVRMITSLQYLSKMVEKSLEIASKSFDDKSFDDKSFCGYEEGTWSEEIQRGAQVITCDVSFISLTKVIPTIQQLGKKDCHFVFLIKPQFELEDRRKRKKGIVNSAEARKEAVKRVADFAEASGFVVVGIAESPITGGDGNMEYLGYFRNSGFENFEPKNIRTSESRAADFEIQDILD